MGSYFSSLTGVNENNMRSNSFAYDYDEGSLSDSPVQESRSCIREASDNGMRCITDANDNGLHSSLTGVNDNGMRSSSFVHDFYEESLSDLPVHECRALHGMLLLNESELDLIMFNCGIPVMNEDRSAKLKRLLEWRRERGDFRISPTFRDEIEEVLIDAAELQRLPDDVRQWTTEILLGLAITDLQLECLLRRVNYDGDNTKYQLVATLMDLKQSSMVDSDFFETLATQDYDDGDDGAEDESEKSSD
ncbi:hypothetical protein KP509_11G094900 [Ceratopteris richardii]|uniref:Uncharacterized protein n=1 Tax=Ceratopteris richardii TaxID=49495 RepID=A0A8T2TXJ5_CERRI|nr:hypothetical protein KP509_11G094900 [Ceratopteris richardii]